MAIAQKLDLIEQNQCDFWIQRIRFVLNQLTKRRQQNCCWPVLSFTDGTRLFSPLLFFELHVIRLRLLWHIQVIIVRYVTHPECEFITLMSHQQSDLLWMRRRLSVTSIALRNRWTNYGVIAREMASFESFIFTLADCAAHFPSDWLCTDRSKKAVCYVRSASTFIQ